MPEEKNRRLLQGSDVIYPITKHENVIGLQKTINAKLPFVSSREPQSVPDRQVWLDIRDSGENNYEDTENNRGFFFEPQPSEKPFFIQEEEPLTFDNNEELMFGEDDQEEINENLVN